MRRLTLLGGILGLASMVGATVLPVSPAAPAVGRKAPDFQLPDSHGKTVSLSALGAAGRGSWVLLVFYRGYW